MNQIKFQRDHPQVDTVRATKILDVTSTATPI